VPAKGRKVDRKLIAALVIGVVGVVTGITGIVMASNAKDDNQETQAQLSKAIKAQLVKDRAGLESTEAASIKKTAKKDEALDAGVKKSENKAVTNADAAGKKAEASAQGAVNEDTTLQSKIDDLEQQIADVEGKQKANTAKVNARIDSLEGRLK